MNKKALLDYALYARKELETQIALSLNKLGIYEDHISEAHIVGDYCIVDGIQESFPKRVYDIRRTIIALHIDNGNFNDVVEEFAYTWFNRIIAIRFMEVHDYFDHGFRVLTSRDGAYEPEILKNLPYVAKELFLNEKVIQDFQEANKTDELYRYVLFKQCNALSEILPLLFDKEAEYLELLLPANLLAQDSFIRKITDIPEQDFMDDVEVVGWLYQFYNSVKKDQVFASKKTITKETLPAVTQLFTPDWIVRYMADNSIGRIWMESYPNSPLKQELEYYVDDAEQEPDVQKKLEEIRYKNVDPQNISIIEPCCGSGHILVYAFDLLYKMYIEKGYDKKDVPSLILGKNLYGLDVDKRAAQLAQFSLIMKARSIDQRFFNENRYTKPLVFEIVDSQSLSSNYREFMKEYEFSKESIALAYEIEHLFKDAKVIGSLLKIENKNYYKLASEIIEIKDKKTPGLLDWYFYHHDLETLRYLCQLANVMSIKYDVMITNPPYCGYSSLEDTFKAYATDNYSLSKVDMSTMFIEMNSLKKGGIKAMITPESWMFLQSYIELRKILLNKHMLSIVHMGEKAFDAGFGTVSFVIKNIDVGGTICFKNLTEYKDADSKNKEFFNKANDSLVNSRLFEKVPNFIIAYKLSLAELSNFNNKILGNYGETKKGILTGKDDWFIRFWYEVDLNKIALNAKKFSDSTRYKWFPVTSGGEKRKWYGNLENVVNIANYGEDIKRKSKNYRLREESYYFKEAITWSEVGGKNFTVRYVPSNVLFGNGGPVCFAGKHNKLLMGFLNSKVGYKYLTNIAPTINFGPEQIKIAPIIITDQVDKVVAEAMRISKEDWDFSETSWDYLYHPYIKFRNSNLLYNDSLSQINERYVNYKTVVFSELKKYEEIINEIFIKLYKLDNEMTAEISMNDITLKKPDKESDIKDFISYLIGVLMGRYSLSNSGLIYAGGKFDRSKYGDYVDEDGIAPVYKYIGIEGGLVDEICKLVREIYGDEYYQDNIDFIAEALDRKTDESAEETINRYLNDDFYNDHLKMYKKRPIYWMLSSGKQGAFKCLIYLHRYNKDTLGLINSKYFLPRTALYKSERERLEARLNSGQLDSRETRNVENQLSKIIKCEEELLEYGQVLDYLANQYIELDLDDGVKENYIKFQGVSLQVNGGTIKKDLLVPFGLEKKK